MSDYKNSNNITVERSKTKTLIDMPQMHSHESHELYFLISGARRYFIRDSIYDISSNDIIVIPKNELHRTVTYQSSGFDRYVVYFTDTEADSIRAAVGSDVFDKFLNCGCTHLSPSHAESFKQILADMERESLQNDSCTPLMLSSKLNELVIHAIRYSLPKVKIADKNTERIQTVARFVTENYDSPITLHDAAQMAYLEDSYFCKQFKKHTGIGFSEYLTNVRMNAAARLLDNSGLSVTEIAEQCGFSGSNYFRDVFKRFYGISPLQYRKRFYKK